MTDLFRYTDSNADRREPDPADDLVLPARPRTHDRPTWLLPAEIEDPPPASDPPAEAEHAIAAERARDQLRRPVPAPERLLPDELAHLQATLPPKTSVFGNEFDRGEAPQWILDAYPDFDPDRIRVGVDRPQAVDYASGMPPKIYADPIGESDLRPRTDQPMPLFAGLPRWEQTEQGALGDCGVIATLGAVAGHRPHDITDAVTDNHDGTYTVTVHEARLDRSRGVSEPTGRTIELVVTSDLPVDLGKETEPAFAKMTGTAWCAVMEKALAGADRAWRAEQGERWRGHWYDDLLPALTADRPDTGSGRIPPPTGFARLEHGTNAYDRAELLTQLTGRSAEVRSIPVGKHAEQPVLDVLTEQLTARRPVIVGSRGIDVDNGEDPELPHGLYPGHAYEVTGVTDGKIYLRNPWNTEDPEPLSPEQFQEYFTREQDDGSRSGTFTTLRD